MTKRILLSLFFTLSISFLFAQDNNITGHWTGKVMNQYDVTYDFVAQGDSLTGKDTHYDGSVSDISNGKVIGDSISFTVPIQGQMTPVTGKLKGEVLTINLSVQGYDISADLKKSAVK
ncbi:MAG TPA: hypothetical protein VLI68_16805 [Hanamia sp.]|nr:hypothetical protein [Hanamia sp.]